MNRRQFLSMVIPSLGVAATAKLPSLASKPAISEADIMAWLVENEFTTKENKEPFQRMNKSLYNAPEGVRITYVWDREPGFSWETSSLTGKREGWSFFTEPTSEGYQLRISGHREVAGTIGS